MNISSLMPLIAVSLAALGCAKTLDLDAPAVQPSTEPGVLGTAREVIHQIAVDGERLYWVGSSEPVGRQFVQSCQKQDCPATIVTYDVQVFFDPGFKLSVKGGQVYWYQASSQELVACPIAGCNGSPRTVLKGPQLADEFPGDGVAFDDERFYFNDQSDSGFSLYSVPLNQPGARQLIASSPFFFGTVTLDESYAYWFTREGLSAGTPASSDPVGYGGLFRTRKDGTSAVETIAKDVKNDGESGFSITTDPTDIYWTDNVLAGSINHCPLAGCSGASDVVTGPLRAPQNLLIDGSELYYVYEAQPYEYALAACSLPACAQQLPLFDKLIVPSALAMDDQYLYLVTSDHKISDLIDTFSDDFISQIRRLPKPNRGLP